jgi:hypothetical protein
MVLRVINNLTKMPGKLDVQYVRKIDQPTIPKETPSVVRLYGAGKSFLYGNTLYPGSTCTWS